MELLLTAIVFLGAGIFTGLKFGRLRSQGTSDTEIATLREQLSKAKSDLADLKTQLTETQDKLDKAEQEIARLQKPPAKK